MKTKQGILYDYTFTKTVTILLVVAITTGCSYLGYRSPIDTRQYVAGLRSLQSDGRDDVKA